MKFPKTIVMMASRMSLLVAVALAAKHAEALPTTLPQSSFDCAATSVFLLARSQRVETTYAQCSELLPDTPNGNSALDVKRVLEKLGLPVRADAVSSREFAYLKYPCIIYRDRKAANNMTAVLGHFFAVLPLSEQRLQLLDFPAPPEPVDISNYAQHLSKVDEEECIVLSVGAPAIAAASVVLDPQDRPPLPPKAGEESTLRLTGTSSVVETYDFGEKNEGATVERRFVIENNAGRDIEIAKVTPSCSCSAVNVESNKVKTGERTAIVVKSSLTGRIGAFSATAVVTFSPSSRMPPAVINVQGTGKARIVAEPAVLDFGEVRELDAEVVRSLQLGAGSPVHRVEVDSVSPLGGDVKAEIVRNTGGVSVRVTARPRPVTGPFVARLKLFDNKEGSVPALTVPVFAKVAPVVTVKPSTLIVSQGEIGQGGGENILLHSENLFSVQSVALRSNGSLNAIFTYTKERSKQVEIRAVAATDREVASDEIVVEILRDGRSEKDVLRIPVIVIR